MHNAPRSVSGLLQSRSQYKTYRGKVENMSHSRLLAVLRGRYLCALGAALALAGCGGGGGSSSGSSVAVAKPFNGITKIVIDPATSEAVTFGGTTFGAVGAYQKIRGVAFGQLDPNDPQNTVITDMALAVKDPATGGVKYSMDFYILKPVDLSKGNHKMFYEANNRGGKQFGGFNGSSGGNNPTTAANAGTAFLMNQGYTLVWSGWDGEVATNTNADILHINLPLAKNVDGSS